MSAADESLATERDEILSKYGLPAVSREELLDIAEEMSADAKRLRKLAEQIASDEEDAAEFRDD